MQNNKSVSGTAALVCLLAGAIVTTSMSTQRAYAAAESDQLEEIIVTAEKREADLQKTALTVSVVSAEDINQFGKTTFEDALQNVPAVQLQTPPVSEAPTPTIAIRGLGTDGNNKAPSVPVYVDGVLVNAENMQLYDVSRVEVLRGPQGTLYGGEAVGGAVNIITNDPDPKAFASSGALDIGTFDTLHTTGMVNVPTGDHSAVRFGFNQLTRANYADSSINDHAEFNARIKYLYEPTDTFSLLLNFEAYRFSGVPVDGFQAQNLQGNLVGPYEAEIGYGGVNVDKYALTIHWDLGFGILTDIAAFQRARDNLQRANIIVNNFNIVHPVKNLGTEELRLASEPGSKISWVMGLYYSDFIERSHFLLGTGNTAHPDQIVVPVSPWADFANYFNFRETAAFGQATFPISDSLRVTGGLRYSDDPISAPQSFQFFANPNSPCGCVVPRTYSQYDRRFHSLDGLVRVDTDLTPTSLLYGSFSTGFRPGATGPGGVGYEAERVRAFEIGSKNRFFNDHLQANLAAYLNNYPAFQNDTTLYLPFGLQLGSVVAVPARFYGIELEIVAQLGPNDKLTLSPALEKARFTGDGTIVGSSPVGGPVTGTLLTDGQQLPHAPSTNVSGSYTHVFRLANGATLKATADAHYESSQAFQFDSCLYNASSCIAEGSSAAQFTQRGYTLADASIGYSSRDDKYSFDVYARNIGNVQYKVGYDTTAANLGAPRTVGIVLSARF